MDEMMLEEAREEPLCESEGNDLQSDEESIGEEVPITQQAPQENESVADAPTEAQSSTDDLLAEITRLREELARRDSMTERFAKEGEEFRSLYPGTDMQTLPDSVWNDVKRGIPLAAAYALAERRRYCTEQKALEYNKENLKRSSGSLEPTEPDYYSPAEVRAMSQNEVRANYDKIMRSMQKWR